jgi:hypothetical protein
MRFATVVLAILFTAPATASDFRMLEFGASCANVAAHESALGAREIKRPDVMGLLAFEGIAFGRRLVFTYFCPKGVLFTGDYYFPSQPLPDAAASYEAVHAQLSATYGVPDSDNSPLTKPPIVPGWEVTDPRQYMTTWRTPRVSITTILLPSRKDEPTGWRVAIHFGQPLDAERSN